MWFALGRDGIRQEYLTKTDYAWMDNSQAFNPDVWRELIRCSASQQPCDYTRLWDIMMMTTLQKILFYVIVYSSLFAMIWCHLTGSSSIILNKISQVLMWKKFSMNSNQVFIQAIEKSNNWMAWNQVNKIGGVELTNLIPKFFFFFCIILAVCGLALLLSTVFVSIGYQFFIEPLKLLNV